MTEKDARALLTTLRTFQRRAAHLTIEQAEHALGAALLYKLPELTAVLQTHVDLATQWRGDVGKNPRFALLRHPDGDIDTVKAGERELSSDAMRELARMLVVLGYKAEGVDW